MNIEIETVPQIDYGYDSRGNRTSKTVADAETDYSYNAANQFTGDSNGTTYTYDNCGNMTEKGDTTYAYNELGEMTGAEVGGTSITYNYDALSRMVKRDTGDSSEYLMLYGTADQPLTITSDEESTSYVWTPDGAQLLGAIDEDSLVHSTVANAHTDLVMTIGGDGNTITSSNIYFLTDCYHGSMGSVPFVVESRCFRRAVNREFPALTPQPAL